MNYFTLLEKLYYMYEKLYNKKLTCNQFVTKIRKAVPFSECQIILTKTLTVMPNDIPVAGLYDADLDSEGHRPIQMEIAVHKIRENFVFNDNDISLDKWATFCIDFAVILGHEYVHMHQFRRRSFKMNRPYVSTNKNQNIRDQQCYFGDSDELDAYAWSAAANAIIERRANKKNIESTELYRTYKKVFNKNDPLVLKFVRKGNRYLKKLEKQKNVTKFK